jgi:hypothetical protein
VLLSAAAEYLEMVFKIASLLTILVMGKKCLAGRSSWIKTSSEIGTMSPLSLMVSQLARPTYLILRLPAMPPRTMGLSRMRIDVGSTSLKVLVAEKEQPVSTMQVKAWGVFLVMSLKSCPEE